STGGRRDRSTRPPAPLRRSAAGPAARRRPPSGGGGFLASILLPVPSVVAAEAVADATALGPAPPPAVVPRRVEEQPGAVGSGALGDPLQVWAGNQLHGRT